MLSRIYTTFSNQTLSPMTRLEDGSYSAYIEDLGGQIQVLHYDDQGICEEGSEFNLRF